MKVAGVDEAGGGPVLGPMVIASASFEEKDSDSLFLILRIFLLDTPLLSAKKIKKPWELEYGI